MLAEEGPLQPAVPYPPAPGAGSPVTYYSPRDQYLWDFWVIRHGDGYHLYHLAAPRSLADPELRHDVASVRHAFSRDLLHWTDRGTVFGPGAPGSWDDLSIWTGSVIAASGGFYMLYTGRAVREAGAVQRIGLAVSQDLHHWERWSQGPILEADPRWYEKVGESLSGTESWRDPYLYYEPQEETFYAFITARVKAGDPMGRGCIASARSRDLVAWEVLPPVVAPGHFYEMEVPTVWKRNGRYYLSFSTQADWYTPEHARAIEPDCPQTGVFYYTSNHLLGPYEPVGNEVLLGTRSGCYASRTVQGPRGEDLLLAWRQWAPGFEGFAGCLDLPRRILYHPEGRLELSPDP